MRLIGLSILMTLGACSSIQNSIQTTWCDLTCSPPASQGMVLVIQLEHDRLVYELNMRNPELVEALIRHAETGYYDGMYIHRSVPGLFVETGEGNWINRTPWKEAVMDHRGDSAGFGQLGFVQNADSTYGPDIIFVRGSTMLEESLIPVNTNVGFIIEGIQALKTLKKGDRIISMAIRRAVPSTNKKAP